MDTCFFGRPLWSGGRFSWFALGGFSFSLRALAPSPVPVRRGVASAVEPLSPRAIKLLSRDLLSYSSRLTPRLSFEDTLPFPGQRTAKTARLGDLVFYLFALGSRGLLNFLQLEVLNSSLDTFILPRGRQCPVCLLCKLKKLLRHRRN